MTITTQGSMTVEIGGTEITLNGLVGKTIQVGFREKYGDDPIKLGTFGDIIGSVADALGVGGTTSFKDQFKTRIDGLGAEGTPLGDIAVKLLKTSVIVTDLEISATYDDAGVVTIDRAAFGFRIIFDDMELGPVKLVGFGVLFEYSPGTKTGDFTSRSSSRVKSRSRSKARL